MTAARKAEVGLVFKTRPKYYLESLLVDLQQGPGPHPLALVVDGAELVHLEILRLQAGAVDGLVVEGVHGGVKPVETLQQMKWLHLKKDDHVRMKVELLKK